MNMDHDLALSNIDSILSNSLDLQPLKFFNSYNIMFRIDLRPESSYFLLKINRANFQLDRLNLLDLLSNKYPMLFLPFQKIIKIDSDYYLCFSSYSNDFTFLTDAENPKNTSLKLRIMSRLVELVFILSIINEDFIYFEPALFYFGEKDPTKLGFMFIGKFLNFTFS